MAICERITIDAAPERIWSFIADPANWPQWNPKFVSIQRVRRGFVVAGEQFSMVSRMKRGESPSEILVSEVMPLRRVTIRQMYSHKNRARHIDVHLQLAARNDRIEVTQTLDHKHSGLPVLLRMLVWFITRFGKPTGPGPLQRLKELAEV